MDADFGATVKSQEPEKCLVELTTGSIAIMPGEMVIPVEVFLHISTSLTFTDFRNMVQVFWPNGNEDDLIRKKLWSMSCHKFEATFYNGKHLEIEYNFDAAREGRYCVLFKVECLLPIFGGVSPAEKDEFVSILELQTFIETNVHLDMCSSYRHVCCPCHLNLNRDDFPILFMEPALSDCEEGHFHHFCMEHVISWLGNYLYTSILLLECKELFDEEIAQQYVHFPRYIPYFQSGSRATPEYLLGSALQLDRSVCEKNDDDNE